MAEDLSSLREKFLKAYASVPLSLRNEIISLVGKNNAPISWDAAYIEIANKTKEGNEILLHLKELGIV